MAGVMAGVMAEADGRGRPPVNAAAAAYLQAASRSRAGPARSAIIKRRRVGVAAGDGGHHARVGDAQVRPRRARASRGSTTAPRARRRGPMRQVPTGWKMVVPMSPGQARQLVVALELRARLDLPRPVAAPVPAARRCAASGAATAAATRRSSSVAQVVRARCVARPRRRRRWRMRTVPARARVEVAHAGGEGVEGVQAARRRPSSDSGCTWYCRFGQARSGEDLREGPELRGRHAHRPAARSRYSQADRAPCPAGSCAIALSVRTPCDAEDGADLQVVLQVLAHARAARARARCRAPAAAPPARCPSSSQQLRRADGPGGHAPPRALARTAVVRRRRQPDARRSAARHRRASLELQAADLRAGPRPQVGPLGTPGAGRPWRRSSARRASGSPRSSPRRRCCRR
jgi:hypothetical protein